MSTLSHGWKETVAECLSALASEGFEPARRATVKNVDWADSMRTQGSAFGPNISDDTVQVKKVGGDWVTTPVIGGENFSDGGVQQIPTNAVNVVTCNADGKNPKRTTLNEVLKGFGTFSPMQDLGVSSKLSLSCDIASYNVNLCFVPASRDVPMHARATTFSYSADDLEPQNLVAVANTQGLGIFADASAAVPLYMQARPNRRGDVHNFDFQVKPDLHGQTIEQALSGHTHTAEQKQAVADLGEATQQVLGPAGVPETSGVLIIKLPLRCHKGYGVARGYRGGQPTKGGVSTPARRPEAVMASVSRGDDMGIAKGIECSPEQDKNAKLRVTQQIWVTFDPFVGDAPSKEDVKRGLLLREKFLEVAQALSATGASSGKRPAAESSIHDEAFVESGITTKKPCLPPKVTTVPA